MVEWFRRMCMGNWRAIRTKLPYAAPAQQIKLILQHILRRSIEQVVYIYRRYFSDIKILFGNLEYGLNGGRCRGCRCNRDGVDGVCFFFTVAIGNSIESICIVYVVPFWFSAASLPHPRSIQSAVLCVLRH